ncbi:hypothetical protein NUU61_000511 [Penicillium alfredii]|uniref:Rhodopsin domain-containing protein n=1 Tax=Penicillium alfredii TaxID=1506179 RepID=A0A9W9KQY9_9EURO|nr:uncharacterized protein NUU61_000511 [Penicillium alfredii]KAJ5114752.1 hypothetical protein NUU61_000511 [Penicillium alfredii]
MISVSLVAIFQCSPVSKEWNPTLPGSCINLQSSLDRGRGPEFCHGYPDFGTTSQTRLGTAGECLAARVDYSSVSKWEFKKRISVVFASIYSFSRIFIFDQKDIAWTLADAQIWCVIETAAGVISACLPTTAPLVKFCTTGVFSTARSLSKSNHTDSRGGAGVVGSASADGGAVGDGSRRSGENYTLGDLGHGNRGSSSQLKGKG